MGFLHLKDKFSKIGKSEKIIPKLKFDNIEDVEFESKKVALVTDLKIGRRKKSRRKIRVYLQQSDTKIGTISVDRNSLKGIPKLKLCKKKILKKPSSRLSNEKTPSFGLNNLNCQAKKISECTFYKFVE